MKAHQEDHANTLPTEHGTGNKLADLIAQNKLSDARLIAPNIKIFTYTLEELFKNTDITPIIHLGNSPSTPAFYIHHPKITEQRFHTLSLNSWLTNVLPSNSLSSLQWADISWNLAGTLISKATANKPHLKTFLLKFLYNALPNLYSKHKYSTKHQNTDSQHDDLPLCPLCNQQADSLSHLYCHCTHQDIQQQRTHLITNIKKTYLNTNPLTHDTTSLTQISNLISETITNTVPDHRCLLGLVHTHHLPPHKPFHEIVKAYQSIAQHTIPYISTIWKTYCTISHNSDNTPTPNTSSRNSTCLPRLTIISGNNGTLSTQTINDHQPTAYSRKKRQHKRPQPTHDPSQRQLPLHFLLTRPTPSSATRITPTPTPALPPSPTTRPLETTNVSWQSPRNPARLPTQVRTNSHQETPTSRHLNIFSPLEITETPIQTHDLTFQMYPNQTAKHINISLPTTQTEILNYLNMTLTDVPPNGDCFYNVIQLFLSSLPDPIHTSIPQLRQDIATFYHSRSGKTILHHYNQQSSIIEHSILPTLKPSLFPNRDIYAQDFVIAAMASILQTNIEVYQHIPSQPPLHITFKPYQIQHSLRITTTKLPYVHIWNENTH